MDISKNELKQLTGSKYHQGSFTPKSPEKCINCLQNKPIIFRSGWESKFFNYLDNNINVTKWGSEVITIQYMHPDGKLHRYIPDIYMEVRDKNNVLTKYLVEVKPLGQGPVADKKGTIHTPKAPKRNTQKAKARYMKECMTFEVNAQKWKAAQEFCRQNGLVFKVITQDDLGVK